MRGRIYRSGKREFEVKIIETGEMVLAIAMGKLQKGDSLVVGDFVKLEKVGDDYHIMEQEERTSEIFRILIRENKKKVNVANCDLLVILNSSSKPTYKRGIVDRFLVRAFQWGIRPIVIFNKMDQYDVLDFDVQFEKLRLMDLGVDCFEISAKFPEYESKYLKDGLEELQETLKGRTAVFVGQSGVGKSKLISLLSDGKADLKTKQVGRGGKGSHTTTWSELVDCSTFQLIDSPGIRSFSLEDIHRDDLLELFPDLFEIARHCKFPDCQHEENIKGCAFYKNDWDEERSELVFSRLASFKQIYSEVVEQESWDSKY